MQAKRAWQQGLGCAPLPRTTHGHIGQQGLILTFDEALAVTTDDARHADSDMIFLDQIGHHTHTCMQ
jgi:hypothetical protein